MHTVYVEILFLCNLIINFMILKIVSKVINKKTKDIRIAEGAAAGAIYAVLYFVYSIRIMKILIIKVLLSVLMVIICFRISKLKDLIIELAALYGVTFLMGGTIYGIINLLNANIIIINGAYYFYDIQLNIILIGIALTYIIVKYTWIYSKKIHFKNQMYINMEIGLENSLTDKIIAMIDTGNSLCDPITGKPVIIVEYKKIKMILPEEIKNIYENELYKDVKILTGYITNHKFKNMLYLIPYNTVSNESLMVAFKPSLVKVYYDNKNIINNDCLIGISEKNLSMQNKFDALLSPDFIYSY